MATDTLNEQARAVKLSPEGVLCMRFMAGDFPEFPAYRFGEAAEELHDAKLLCFDDSDSDALTDLGNEVARLITAKEWPHGC